MALPKTMLVVIEGGRAPRDQGELFEPAYKAVRYVGREANGMWADSLPFDQETVTLIRSQPIFPLLEAK